MNLAMMSNTSLLSSTVKKERRSRAVEIDFSDIQAIIRENERKKDELFGYYNPVTGEGSPIERERLFWDDENFILIPKQMAELPMLRRIIDSGSVSVFAQTNGLAAKEIEKAILRLRIEYDFEFWSATCAKIQDKLTKTTVPFILRRPQRKLLKVLLELLYAGEPIRIILLKARQWGGSTLVQLFMAWIQLYHKKAWHSAIVADVEDQSRNIKAMYSRLAENHPREILPVRFRSFEGSTKNKKIEGRDCVIYIGSMQQPDSIRSADVMMAHLSEVGLWKETKGKKPEDLIQSIAGTVPKEPYSMIVLESTAKGIGTYFHREWQKSGNGDSGYVQVFVSWYEIEMYFSKFADDAERDAFIASMSDKEKYYFELGATLEGIKWYREKKRLESYDDWRMGCEFPTTPEEAFQSTGRRAHAPEYVQRMRKFTKPPVYMGEMYANSRAGKGAIDKSLEFQEQPGGGLWLWALPDKETPIKRRYVVSVDIGGRSVGADWSVISIIDRYFLMEGGVEECIGTWRGHLDQDLVIWQAVQIAKFFNSALLVVESNSLDMKGDEGDHSLTILDEIKDFYPHMFFRTDPQKIREGAPVRYGFHTNKQTKTDLVNQMNKRFRELGHIERDARALDEADCYEIKPDGTYGAVDGEHDDIYMSRGIGLKASQMMEPPVYVVEKSRPRRSGHVLTESSV